MIELGSMCSRLGKRRLGTVRRNRCRSLASRLSEECIVEVPVVETVEVVKQVPAVEVQTVDKEVRKKEAPGR